MNPAVNIDPALAAYFTIEELRAEPVTDLDQLRPGDRIIRANACYIEDVVAKAMTRSNGHLVVNSGIYTAVFPERDYDKSTYHFPSESKRDWTLIEKDIARNGNPPKLYKVEQP